MEHVSSSMDLPVSGMQMRMIDSMPNNPQPQHFSVPKELMGLMEPMPSTPGFNTLVIPDKVGNDGSSGGSSMGSSRVWMSNHLGREDAVMLSNMTGQKTSLPEKRKAEIGPLSPNKRPAHLEAHVRSLGSLQSSSSPRSAGPSQPSPRSPALQSQSALNKKMARNDSVSGKSGLQRGQPGKKQTTQIESASKPQAESSEAVRSKMRESLAAALALASLKPDNVSNTVKKHSDATSVHIPVVSQTSESNSTAGGNIHGYGSEEVFPSKELALPDTTNDSQVSAERPPNESSINGAETYPEFQYNSILHDEDMRFSDNFFVKDDLLQGNGLSWAFELDMQMREGKEDQNADKTQPVREEAEGHKEIEEVVILTPENLALEIEAELFRQYGGVNKKYKEKGRSLLFNLKDRNNPELRERVMSGEISPERLCSMSAEELASKELSEWRMAKAEEMAQMVVLPDTEVDVRRLVKKTHKGEYQIVEFERDDGIAEEVSGGSSMITQPHQKKVTEIHSPAKASLKDEENVAYQENMDNQDFSGSLVIPTDGTDLMQGMMVDELKDTEFLPPIVSLDEFMESLNSEPPFENIPADAVQNTPVSHEETEKVVNKSRATDQVSDSPKDASSKKADVRKQEVDTTLKSSRSPEQKVRPSIVASDVDYIWEGILQLNIASSVTVRGIFQSGEKTSTKEWSTSLEIKGRVRVDAFEKFLQELPMSRTRAVMVLQFVLKDNSKNQLSDLSEAIDSYKTDERLGYAEPSPGVEIYLCPPIPRISEMLNKHLPNKPSENNNNSLENRLIGVVVWRRPHISNTISPNHHKHGSKKQPFARPNRPQDSPNVNVSNTPIGPPPSSVPNNVSHSKPEQQPGEEDDDDIPPGFGPTAAARAAAAQDEDDLPEFNFSGDLNPSVARVPPQSFHHGGKMTQRPVDQVRALIQKYGQSGNSDTSRGMVGNRVLGIEPWNDDEDDDIPEWRPQAPLQQPHHHPHHPYPAVGGHRPPVHHLLPTNQHVGPMVGPQSPRGVAHPPPGGRWAQPTRPVHGARWRPH